MKRDWFDSIVGIIGLLISIFPFMLKFLNIDNFKDEILYINFFLGMAIIALIIWKQNKSIITKKISPSELAKKVISTSKSLNHVLIYNPNKNIEWTNELNNYLIENIDVQVSYVGDSQGLLTIFEKYTKEQLARKTDTNFVSSFSYDVMLIVMSNKQLNKFVIGFIEKNDCYLIEVRNKETIELLKLLYKRDTLFKNNIDLDDISEPSTFLDIINREKERYIKNFKNLKTGHISFYGTEVLNTQSGWLESGNFKELTTLDLTSNPALLLTRKRYNKANEEFIRNGGKIRRVYMISKEKTEDPDFVRDLINLINYQKGVGIVLGLQYLEDLTAEQRQDFILYDEFTVLIEEGQANSDYTFGKSTAYFHQEKVKDYKRIFLNVWNGDNMEVNAAENLRRFLQKYNTSSTNSQEAG